MGERERVSERKRGKSKHKSLVGQDRTIKIAPARDRLGSEEERREKELNVRHPHHKEKKCT